MSKLEAYASSKVVSLDCEGEHLRLTMATLRPKWFLISPVFIASGACSCITW